MQRHPRIFADDPHGNTHSHHPPSDAERARASRAARPGNTGHR
jgi:hypothetical protein